MAFAVSETSRLHAAVSIGPLEKNLRPASKIADLSHCVAFRGAPTLHNVGRSGTCHTPEPTKCPTFNIPFFRRGNCPLLTGRFGGVAYVTHARGVQTRMDEEPVVGCCGDAGSGRFTMGATYQKTGRAPRRSSGRLLI